MPTKQFACIQFISCAVTLLQVDLVSAIIYLVPVLRFVGDAQLQQHQLLMLADALADAVVHTLTCWRWILQLYVVVAASRPNHCKSATA